MRPASPGIPGWVFLGQAPVSALPSRRAAAACAPSPVLRPQLPDSLGSKDSVSWSRGLLRAWPWASWGRPEAWAGLG